MAYHRTQPIGYQWYAPYCKNFIYLTEILTVITSTDTIIYIFNKYEA